MPELPYRRYVVWTKANELALEVLSIADREPLKSRYWMNRQVCSAAMSIPANIAEGIGRGTNLDFATFLDNARGSLFELDVWLNALCERAELAPDRYHALGQRIMELNAMLLALRAKLRSDATTENRRRS